MRTIGLAGLAVLAAACARHRVTPNDGPRSPPGAVAIPDPAPPPPPARDPPPPPRPTTRQTLHGDTGLVVELYPPLDPSAPPAPLVVFLHATCMEPADICDYFSEGAREGSYLLCPAGPSTCYGAPDWSGPPKLKADTLAAALAAAERDQGAWIDHRRGDVLVGYSRGAFAARDILYQKETAGRFHGLVLISAAVSPEPSLLKAAGIRRVVLATGDLDGSRPTMRAAERRLSAAGIPTRFVSLGRVGHWLPRDIASILREAIAWVNLPQS